MEDDPLPERTELLATAVMDAMFEVHRALGPGLLESVYEVCLCHELAKRQVPFKSQASLPIVYDTIRLEAGLRLDLLIDDHLIVEIKAAEKLIPLHEARPLTYLELTGIRLGLLVNFNTTLLKDGIKRVVH